MFKVLTTAAVLLSASFANAATLNNGGFASGTAFGGFQTVNAVSSAIPGWTVSGGSVDWIATYWQSADGDGYSIDLDGNAAGTISQVVTGLNPGWTYLVSFWLAANPDSGQSPRDVDVSAGGPAQTFSYALSGGTKSAMNWQQYGYTFTATSTSQTLSFASATPGAFGAALDAVSISTVPVPAGGLLLLSGLGGIAALRRRKR